MISLLVSGLVLIVILSFLVFIHELGHFLVAKRVGVKVEEFGFGYPPRLLMLFRHGGTKYTLNWIPFGGFVRLYGHERRVGGKKSEARRKGAFWAQSFKRRVVVIFGGVVMNFLFGVVAFSVIYSFLGIPRESGKVIVVGLQPESVVAQAGLQIEDMIVGYWIGEHREEIVDSLQLVKLGRELSGEEVILEIEREGEGKDLTFTFPKKEKVILSGLAVRSPAKEAGMKRGDVVEMVEIEGKEEEIVGIEQFVALIEEYKGEELIIKVAREEEQLAFKVVPRENPPEGQGPLGVSLSPINFSKLDQWELPFRGSWLGSFAVAPWGVALDTVELVKYPVWQMPFEGAWAGLRQAAFLTGVLIQGVSQMVKDLVVGGMIPEDVAGPVGIIYFSLKTDLLKQGLLVVLNFIALVSINLAILNLLPLPGLDGYWLMFLGLEAALKEKFKPKYEQWASLIGLVTIMLLVVLISIKDVGRVVADEDVRRWFGEVLERLWGGF